MMNRIGVTTTTSVRMAEAKELAAKLHIDLISNPQDIISNNYRYILKFTPDYLGIYQPNVKKAKPFYIDFSLGKLLYRAKHAGLRKELIAKAIGISPRQHPIIIDATAGLGRDSFILATLGFSIIMLERSPIIYALLDDAIKRARLDPIVAEPISRLKLIQADAIEWLKMNGPLIHPDVIYLDPMFPDRQKSALVKKEMIILQELLGKDTDCDKLFESALTCAKNRIVVKRPRLAGNIVEHAPNFSLSGKNSRFDIYITKV